MKKIIFSAFLLAGITFHQIYSESAIIAQTVYPVHQTVSPPTAIPTPTSIPTPEYTLGKYKDNDYARYIWSKWESHGNYLQAVALCTNIAEGNLQDEAYNVNTDGSFDKGCWQYNSIHQLPDDVTMDCYKATDYTYNVWLRRIKLGFKDGFSGMWYGYGSRNYYQCFNNLHETIHAL